MLACDDGSSPLCYRRPTSWTAMSAAPAPSPPPPPLARTSSRTPQYLPSPLAARQEGPSSRAVGGCQELPPPLSVPLKRPRSRSSSRQQGVTQSRASKWLEAVSGAPAGVVSNGGSPPEAGSPGHQEHGAAGCTLFSTELLAATDDLMLHLGMGSQHTLDVSEGLDSLGDFRGEGELSMADRPEADALPCAGTQDVAPQVTDAASPKASAVVSPGSSRSPTIRSSLPVKRKAPSLESAAETADQAAAVASGASAAEGRVCSHSGCPNTVKAGQWYCSSACSKAAEREALVRRRARAVLQPQRSVKLASAASTSSSSASQSRPSPNASAVVERGASKMDTAVRTRLQESLTEGLLQAVREAEACCQGDSLSIPTPAAAEDVAAEVEVELFRAFGGLGKRYRDRARSLVFNLKDKANPELRARVLSREISAAALCQMSAEQLASKELSQWRSAKAEALGSLKVLTGGDAELRIVKKTHKGEEEVLQAQLVEAPPIPPPTAARSLDEVQLNKNVTGDGRLSEEGEQVSPRQAEQQTHLEDAASDGQVPVASTEVVALPKIMSMDEYVGAHRPGLVEDDIAASTEGGRAPMGTASTHQGNQDAGVTGAGVKPRADASNSIRLATQAPPGALWHGSLQLTTSQSCPVYATYYRRERLPLKDLMQDNVVVKGRVKLSDMPKFLKEMPTSRSRAIMIALLRPLVDDETQMAGSPTAAEMISEAAEGYLASQRVGLAEPCLGMELYLFPPGGETAALLAQLTLEGEGGTEELTSAAHKGLVALFVARRTHLPAAVSRHLPLASSPAKPPPAMWESRPINQPGQPLPPPPSMPVAPPMLGEVVGQLPTTRLPPGFGGPKPLAVDEPRALLRVPGRDPRLLRTMQQGLPVNVVPLRVQQNNDPWPSSGVLPPTWPLPSHMHHDHALQPPALLHPQQVASAIELLNSGSMASHLPTAAPPHPQAPWGSQPRPPSFASHSVRPFY
eukprot:SM000379S14404  [mRNA]  locus=s379:16612:21277:+ [translate_table: standard]